MRTPSPSSTSDTRAVRAPLCWRMLLSASCSTRRSAIRCESVIASKAPARVTEVSIPVRRSIVASSRRDGGRERLLQERARLERVGEVAQVAVQVGELRLEIGEAGERALPMLGPEDGGDAVAQDADVLREDVDLLQRAVVQVEAEPDEQALVRRREPADARASRPSTRIRR